MFVYTKLDGADQDRKLRYKEISILTPEEKSTYLIR